MQGTECSTSMMEDTGWSSETWSVNIKLAEELDRSVAEEERRQRSRKAVWEESVKWEGEEIEREEKQAEQGRMGKGGVSADDNPWEEDADVTGQKTKKQKQMTLFVFMDRGSVLPTHTCINTPQMMKDKNKEIKKRGQLLVDESEWVKKIKKYLRNACIHNSFVADVSLKTLVDIKKTSAVNRLKYLITTSWVFLFFF